jgi:hypothetical protein
VYLRSDNIVARTLLSSQPGFSFSYLRRSLRVSYLMVAISGSVRLATYIMAVRRRSSIR